MLVEMQRTHQSDCGAPPDGRTAYEAYREGWRTRDELERERTEQAWRIIRKLRAQNITLRREARTADAVSRRILRFQDKSQQTTLLLLSVAVVLALIGWAAYFIQRPMGQEALPVTGTRMAVGR